MNTDDKYTTPFDEGYRAAKEGYIDAKMMALPIHMFGDQLQYNDLEWRQFINGARKALTEMNDIQEIDA
jgi:hypothetical protein